MFTKENISYPLFVFLGVFAVYILSFPTTVVVEDDGLFLLAAWNNGIAHPPGYPLFTLLSHISTWFLPGSIATRVHLFNAFLGSLSCLVLFQVLQRLNFNKLFSATGALLLGFSNGLWSQSIIAEVYTLNVLIFLMTFYLALLYMDCPDTEKQLKLLKLLVFVIALGLSNHWPLFILSMPIILFICWSKKSKLIQQLKRAWVYVIPGLIPYVWMVLRSQADPLISFYGPINTFEEFLFMVSRQGYAEIDNSITAGIRDKLAFVRFLFIEVIHQFGVVGAPFLMLGFFCQHKYLSRRLAAGLTITFFVILLSLGLMLGFDYDFYHQNIIRPYPLVAFCIASIWTMIGIKWASDWFLARHNSGVRPEFLPVAVSVFVITSMLIVNFQQNNRKNDSWAEEFAMVVLNNLERDAILFTYGDLDMWTIGYMHYVEEVRPDITLYSTKGNVFSNRLFKQHHLTKAEMDSRIHNFIRHTDRPVYYVNTFVDGYSETDYAIYKKINRNLDSKLQQVVILPEVSQFLSTLHARGEPFHNWEKMHYREILATSCSSLMKFSVYSNTTDNQDIYDLKNKVCNNFQGYLVQADYLLESENRNLRQISELLERAEGLLEYQVLKNEKSKLYYLQGRLLALQDNMAAAKLKYIESYQNWPSPNNPALLYVDTE